VPDEDSCPERPSGAKNLSSYPKKDFYPAYPDPIGEKHRAEAPLFSFTNHCPLTTTHFFLLLTTTY